MRCAYQWRLTLIDCNMWACNTLILWVRPARCHNYLQSVTRCEENSNLVARRLASYYCFSLAELYPTVIENTTMDQLVLAWLLDTIIQHKLIAKKHWQLRWSVKSIFNCLELIEITNSVFVKTSALSNCKSNYIYLLYRKTFHLSTLLYCQLFVI